MGAAKPAKRKSINYLSKSMRIARVHLDFHARACHPCPKLNRLDAKPQKVSLTQPLKPEQLRVGLLRLLPALRNSQACTKYVVLTKE